MVRGAAAADPSARCGRLMAQRATRRQHRAASRLTDLLSPRPCQLHGAARADAPLTRQPKGREDRPSRRAAARRFRHAGGSPTTTFERRSTPPRQTSCCPVARPVSPAPSHWRAAVRSPAGRRRARRSSPRVAHGWRPRASNGSSAAPRGRRSEPPPTCRRWLVGVGQTPPVCGRRRRRALPTVDGGSGARPSARVHLRMGRRGVGEATLPDGAEGATGVHPAVSTATRAAAAVSGAGAGRSRCLVCVPLEEGCCVGRSCPGGGGGWGRGGPPHVPPKAVGTRAVVTAARR